MPNKAVSKKQYNFFRAVQGGSVKAPGLSPDKAGEMLGHQSPKGLPNRASHSEPDADSRGGKSDKDSDDKKKRKGKGKKSFVPYGRMKG